MTKEANKIFIRKLGLLDSQTNQHIANLLNGRQMTKAEREQKAISLMALLRTSRRIGQQEGMLRHSSKDPTEDYT